MSAVASCQSHGSQTDTATPVGELMRTLIKSKRQLCRCSEIIIILLLCRKFNSCRCRWQNILTKSFLSDYLSLSISVQFFLFFSVELCVPFTSAFFTFFFIFLSLFCVSLSPLFILPVHYAACHAVALTSDGWETVFETETLSFPVTLSVVLILSVLWITFGKT